MKYVIQILRSTNLGLQDFLHHVQRHFREENVMKHHGSVGDATDRWTSGADIVDHSGTILLVGDISKKKAFSANVLV